MESKMPTATAFFNIEEASNAVKQQVFGQDEHVDKIIRFIHAALTRSILIKSGTDANSLPRLSSMLLVAPTASGKTHTITTIAKAIGLPMHTIDAGALTGEGWSGNNISSEWLVISEMQKSDPSKVILVFVDEIDKLTLNDSHEPSFSPKFDLLKPLDGGIITGDATGGGRKRYEMDCDRCIFIFSGAFTGIEDKIAERLKTRVFGFGYQEAETNSALQGEDGLRAQITLEDIEAWGFPREFVGRFSFVDFMPALSEESLAKILFEGLLPNYNNMMMGGKLTISKEAADAMVEKALSENYGARSLNQQLSKMFFADCWSRVASSDHAVEAKIALSKADELECVVEETGRRGTYLELSKSLASSNEARRRVHHRLEAVNRKARKIKDGSARKVDPFEAIGDNHDRYAASLLAKTETQAGGYSEAEIVLLNALLNLVRDWYEPIDFEPKTIKSLLSMTEINDPEHKSPLDMIFSEIKEGRYCTKNPKYKKGKSNAADTKEEPEYIWMDSPMIRHAPQDPSNGAPCGDGFDPEDDDALGFYTDFKSFPWKEQVEAITSLSYRYVGAVDAKDAA